ncbi:hypothetical protein ABFS83_13G028600 [Erythranthe nasuta]
MMKKKSKMKYVDMEEQVPLEPMSPSAQYLKSSALSLTILAVLELQHPIEDSVAIKLVKEVFLPINPRFSSIMVAGGNGEKKWKRVEVNLDEHIHVPVFPATETGYHDEFFGEYLSGMAAEELPPHRPLWEIHMVKHRTRSAAESVVFKLHHSLGDGYSLMGALLSCLQRLDDPSIPLTFPAGKSCVGGGGGGGCCSVLRRGRGFFKGMVHTACDFGWSVLKSSLIEDDESPIRSGDDGVEFRPIVTSTTTFSIDQIKQIKTKLNVTINDVVTGIIMLGTRLYMQKASQISSEAKSTALVLLNTRAAAMGAGYKSVSEMVEPGSKMPWGNRFAFLHVPIPKLSDVELLDPLIFVKKVHRTIKKRRNSAGIYLTGQLLDLIRKIKGPESASRYIHGTLKNTSMAISNLIGPIEPMALANQPINGLYFAVAGPPQSLSVTIVSYVGKLRIAMTVEKGFMDPNKLKSCVEYAFEAIYKAALQTPVAPTKS